jgi:hypothetical protein
MARTLVLLAVALLVAGAGDRPAAHASRVVAQQETVELPNQLVVAGLSRDGEPLRVSLSASAAFQAGTVMVTASEGTAGTATIFGRSYPLMESTSGGLSGFVGLGTEDPVGPAMITIDVQLADGTAEHVTRGVEVLQTRWTVDYITIDTTSPGGENLLDPAIVVAEQNLLNSVYAGASAAMWRPGWTAPIAADPLQSCLNAGATLPCVSGYFGEQRSFNGGPVSGHHGGTDLAAEAGTPVLATNDGVVALAEPLKVRGNMVIIDHGGGVFSSYGHLQSLAVEAGKAVARGDVVAYVGSTGLSTGPHLHWEMAVSGVLVDGLRWLDGSQGF